MTTKTNCFNKIMAVMMAIVLAVAVLSFGVLEAQAETTSTWDGTTDTTWYETTDPQDSYTITTAAQLAGLASLVNAGTTFSGITVTLAANIDLANIAWTAIGSSSTKSFQGTFDGGNYTISNLYISNSISWYQGLFGYVKNGTIKNINVSGRVTGSVYTAGIVAYIVATTADITVDNCSFTGTVSGTECVGGIVGSARCVTESDYEGPADDSDDWVITISNCSNAGTVTGSNACVAGVVGYVGSCKSSTVDNCTNTGNVTSTSVYVGGVIGWIFNNCTVTNCSNTGTIQAVAYVGGVIGEVNGSASTASVVENCINTGNVTSTSTGNSYVGGIIGRAYTNSTSTTLTVESCLNTGDITGSGAEVAGIVGSIENGSVTATNCLSEGNVSGTSSVGGVIGGVAGTSLVLAVEDCYYSEDAITDKTGLTTYATALTADAYEEQKEVYLEYLESLKDEATITVLMSGWVYGQTASVPSYTTTSDGDEVTYTYYADADCTEEVADITTAAAGTYYVTATIASTDTYQTATSEAVAFSITQAATSDDPADEDADIDDTDVNDTDIDDTDDDDNDADPDADADVDEDDTDTEADEDDDSDEVVGTETGDSNTALPIALTAIALASMIVLMKKKALVK